jgi:hypothetical protein
VLTKNGSNARTVMFLGILPAVAKEPDSAPRYRQEIDGSAVTNYREYKSRGG